MSDDDYLRGGTGKDFYNKEDVENCNCPVCDKDNSSYICNERGSIGIVKCNSCNLIYVNPRVKNSTTNYHGKSEIYAEEARLIFNGKKRHHRDVNYEYELKKIQSYKRSGKLLDIGCNMGFFLRKARDLGFDSYGIDASPSLSDIARTRFGLNVKTSFFSAQEYEANTFDVVTLIDVLEHISNPVALLKEVNHVLNDNGIVCIKVPNGNYNYLKFKILNFLGRTQGKDIWDSYEHLGHYTITTMKTAVRKAGLEVKSVIVPIPIQSPVWHRLVGHYYQYPSPWYLDWKNYILRNIFYFIGKVENMFGINPTFAPDLMFILKKIDRMG